MGNKIKSSRINSEIVSQFQSLIYPGKPELEFLNILNIDRR